MNTIKKILGALLLCTSFTMFAQKDTSWVQRYLEAFPYLMYGNAPVSDTIIQKIKALKGFNIQYHILFYKMVANPDLTEDDYVVYKDNARLTLPPEQIILPQPWNDGYELIYDIERLQYWNKPDLYFKNFYVITKRGNRFVNTDWNIKYNEPNKKQLIEPYTDTISFNFWDSIFPYDHRYIFYYDGVSKQVVPVGGDLVTGELDWNWFEGANKRDYGDIGHIALFYCQARLDRFNMKREGFNNDKLNILYFHPEFVVQPAIDSLQWMWIGVKTKNPHHTMYFYSEGMDLTEGLPAIVKTTSNAWIFKDPVEVTYYRTVFIDDTTAEDGYRYHWEEVKYILKNRPTYKDNQPVIRILPEEEVKLLRNSPYKIFFRFPINEAFRRLEEWNSRFIDN